METLERQIIAKQEELIQTQKDWMILRNIPCEIRDVDWISDIQKRKIEIGKIESELATLKSELFESELKQESFTSNDIDLAYLTGCFNVVGIDGLAKEIERLKGLGLKPHDIFDLLKQPELKDSGGKLNKAAEVDFMQIRDLTDEEWLKRPKEEILQLYKNCYAMLENYIGLSGEKTQDVKTYTSTDASQFQQPTIDERKEIMEKYGITEDIVDDYMKQFQQPITMTDKMLEKEFPTDIDTLRKEDEFLGNVYTRSTINKHKQEAAKWALSLKAQKLSDGQYPKVELNKIFECGGLLYTIVIPKKASTETNLSHGRIICEIEKI